MKRKRGQKDAGGAAGLVSIILLLILFYIVFLPPEDRADLLSDDNESDDDDGVDGNRTLLREFPGELSIVDQRDADVDIPNVFLFESRNAEVLETFNPFNIRNGVFDKQEKTLNFGVKDLENTDNVLLSFITRKHEGVLNINFNGVDIFNFDIQTENPDPIKLNGLRENNVIDFSVSSVGAKFWKTNEYSFEDVKVVGDITDTTRQQSRNVFTLEEDEFQNLEKAVLRFVPYCRNEVDVGILDVFINNRNIYSAIPICDDPVRQDFSIGTLNSGTNNVVFKSVKGSYSIEQIEFQLDLKKTKSIVYFFEVNESHIEGIRDNDFDAILEIIFVDDDEEKIADLNINDHLRRFDLEEESSFSLNIDSFIEEGNNFVEIRPKTVLRIVQIEVRLEED